MCLGVGLWLPLIWNSLSFLDPDVCFFSQVREVYSLYFFNFSIPFCLLFFGTPIMQILVCLMVSYKLSSLFIIFFLFAALIKFYFPVFKFADPLIVSSILLLNFSVFLFFSSDISTSYILCEKLSFYSCILKSDISIFMTIFELMTR